ncbi:MAG: M48 family metalloprotease [Desulfobacterales bacterium]|nr:M48 family metalloprotease [Desulfobacterales bacterium]
MKNPGRREFLRFAGKYAVLGLGAVPVLSGLISGCKGLEVISDIAVTAAEVTGYGDEANLIVKGGKAIAKTFEDFTPEQEYYIGRTVGAVILNKYKPYKNEKANRFINVLGQTLARASDRPETFRGYHFMILDSNEINALAAPGGLIFITRGMLRCCNHEDAAAAVLAHEIGHVSLKHGLRAIKNSRITSAFKIIGIEAAKTFGGEELASLTRTFEGAISDVTSTLIDNGYSRSFEREADKAAVSIMRRLGYNPSGLADMLSVMDKKLKPGGLGFAKTHPSPVSRIANIKKNIGGYTKVKIPTARQSRFMSFLRNV